MYFTKDLYSLIEHSEYYMCHIDHISWLMYQLLGTAWKALTCLLWNCSALAWVEILGYLVLPFNWIQLLKNDFQIYSKVLSTLPLGITCISEDLYNLLYFSMGMVKRLLKAHTRRNMSNPWSHLLLCQQWQIQILNHCYHFASCQYV